MNPTTYFFGNQRSIEHLLEREAQHVMDFKNWLDGTLFINHEFKERTKSYNLTQPPQDETIRVATIEENNFSLEMKEEQGSSSANEKPFQEITWGTRKTPDNEEALQSFVLPCFIVFVILHAFITIFVTSSLNISDDFVALLVKTIVVPSSPR
jgi:hypothetical protein